MPGRYRVYDGEYNFQWGSLVAIDKQKVTIKLDNGTIITDPPFTTQYIGTCSDRQLKRMLKKEVKTDDDIPRV